MLSDWSWKTVDHDGADAGYPADMTRFPEQHFSAAVLCNSADTSPASLVRKVADVYVAQDFKDPEKSAGGAAGGAGPPQELALCRRASNLLASQDFTGNLMATNS
jgi:hypothetical protein